GRRRYLKSDGSGRAGGTARAARADPTAGSRAPDVRAFDAAARAAVEVGRARQARVPDARTGAARRQVAGVGGSLAGHESRLAARRTGGAADGLAAATRRHGALDDVRDAAHVAAVVR